MKVVLGKVLSIFSPASAAEIGFMWNPVALAWVRPGLPMLSNLAGPLQHFRSAILDAWRNKVAGDLCGRKGFGGGPLLDIHGSLQLLNSSHVRERDTALLRSIMVGGVWNGFLLGQVRNQVLPCRFLWKAGLMVALFLIRSPVFLLLELGSLLISLSIFGMIVGGDHVDRVQSEGDFPSCRGFCSVPGPLQSVQRAEMRCVSLALQSSGAVHPG